MGQDTEEPPPYIHIRQNEFLHRKPIISWHASLKHKKHKKQKEEDIAICECKLDASGAGSACGDECLNVLTNTECTPLYCPCDKYCQNQRFQKCQYARTNLFKTEGRGWGLLADEDIKAGQFVIEYCGEVISRKEAWRRSHAYENQGLKDAFIISLNASESIDATRKGSHARFINHSCRPNCETRKWHVLGEIRVGIFAKEDIPAGTELSYDYNFEWYGGAKVRCLCGAATCSGFLGAKSRGFQEDTYLWEDDDDRYSVEKIPLYDSAEDEPNLKLQKIADSIGDQYATEEADLFVKHDSDGQHKQLGPSAPVDLYGVPIHDKTSDIIPCQPNDGKRLYSEDSQKILSPNDALMSQIQSNIAGRNHQSGPASVSKKRSKVVPKERQKAAAQHRSDAKFIAEMFAPKETQQEILKYEDMRNGATVQLDSLYNEIRPAIEEYERDSQDSVATSIAEKWVEASCLKMKAEFDLYSSMVRHILLTPRRIEPPYGDIRIGQNCLTFNPSSDNH